MGTETNGWTAAEGLVLASLRRLEEGLNEVREGQADQAEDISQIKVDVAVLKNTNAITEKAKDRSITWKTALVMAATTLLSGSLVSALVTLAIGG